MSMLKRGPVDFKDPPGLPSYRRHMTGAAGIFFRLPTAKQDKLDSAQRRDPYGENGLVQLERVVVAERTGHHLDDIERAANALTDAALKG